MKPRRSTYKGERKQVAATRISPTLYDAVDEAAARLGATKSDFLADLMAQAVGRPEESPLYGRGGGVSQLDMTA